MLKTTIKKIRLTTKSISIKLHISRIQQNACIMKNKSKRIIKIRPKRGKLKKEMINHQQSSRKFKLPSTTTNNGQNDNTSSKSFLNKLCKFFANIRANMISKKDQTSSNQTNIHSKRCVHSFVMHEISEDEVRTFSTNVKAHTAHGFDHTPAKFVKIAACFLTPFLTRIFNKCVEQETFPND